MKRTFKAASFYILIFVTLIICSRIQAEAATVKASRADKKAIQQYIKNSYGKGYRYRIIKGGTCDNALAKRKGSKTVMVEQFRTRSKGKTGIVISGPCKGYVVGYARRQGKGKTVVTYLVYSPYSNAMDDITAIVTKGKVR